ncbi:MAG: hypothetical protein RL563_1619 [Pseudomonadota bacterium]
MQVFTRYLRWFLAFAVLALQTGCVYWWHAYQTYLQMDEFDQYFSVTAKEDFTVHFKEPKLLSEDFVSLAKLHASLEETSITGKKWRYWFRKIDKQGQLITPEVSFYLDLAFDKQEKIIDWTFSNLFLQIAPPEFLEASFRSLGGAEINEEKQQLKAKAANMEKIAAKLPKKAVVIERLGEPMEAEQEAEFEIYKYHFRLDAKEIEEGYEDRALSEVKLFFDKKTTELVKMSGRFAGLKISINYRNFQDEEAKG